MNEINTKKKVKIMNMDIYCEYEIYIEHEQSSYK